MRITGISDIVVPISSAIRNAYIDFSQMTASVVAIHTDVVRDGKPVVGFGFNSNGRYAPQGLLRERFIPRLKTAKPDKIVDANGLLDPAKCWDVMMRNEKPGGHGERSVAVGVLDMALWDALAKAEGAPLWRLLADRYNGGKADDTAWVYAAGGYYYPDKDISALQDEMKRYLDLGYSTVKMKIGGVPLKDDIKRIEAVLKLVGKGENLCVDVNGRYDLDEALACGDAIAPYHLRWYEEPLDPLDYLLHAALADALPTAARHRREPVLHARRAQPDPPRRLARRPRLAAVRSGAVLRAGRISAHARYAQRSRLVAPALCAAWRASVRFEHRSGLGSWRQRVLSAGVRAVRRLRRQLQSHGQPCRHAGRAGRRLRGKDRAI